MDRDAHAHAHAAHDHDDPFHDRHGHGHHDHDHDHDHRHDGPDMDDAFYDEDGLVEDDPWVDRRRQATAALIAGSVTFLVSLVVLGAFMAGGPLMDLLDFMSLGVWIAIFSVLLLAFLIWMLVLFFSSPGPGAEGDWYDEDAFDDPDAVTDAAGVDEAVEAVPETITLRCPRCTNIFSVVDTGSRPLRHICPHCNARGLYE